MNKQTALWLGIGCSVGCVVVSFLAILLGGGLLVMFGLQEPEDIAIQLDVPTNVTVNEEFTINFRIENSSSTSQIVDSIDFEAVYLEGFVITSSEPPFNEALTIPVFDYESYAFGSIIPNGEAVSITFNVVALQPGDYTGEVDVCINDGFSCTTRILRTVIQN